MKKIFVNIAILLVIFVVQTNAENYDLNNSISPNYIVQSSENDKLLRPYETIINGSKAIAVGNINNDNLNDIATVSWSKLKVLLQDENGNLNYVTNYGVNIRNSIAIGDVNNDSLNDVVAATENGIGVFLQNNMSNLSSVTEYLTDNNTKLKIADFNNDNLEDVATIGGTNNLLKVFLQDSTGSLTKVQSYFVEYGVNSDLVTGDFDNDGRTDIVVMNGVKDFDNIGILIQNQTGVFSETVYYDIGINISPNGICAGDLNGDGLADLALTYGEDWMTSRIGILYQGTQDLFNSFALYNTYDNPKLIETADINGDGLNDLVFVHGSDNIMSIYLQDKQNEFIAAYIFDTPSYNIYDLVLEDVNNDGVNDVILSTYNLGVFYGVQTNWVYAPTNVKATDGDYPHCVEISWSGVYNAVEYEVYRVSDNVTNMIGTEDFFLDDPRYRDYSVDQGTIYHYFVKAISSYGESDFSKGDDGYAFIEIKAAEGWKYKTSRKGNMKLKTIIKGKNLYCFGDLEGYLNRGWRIKISYQFLDGTYEKGPYKLELKGKSKNKWYLKIENTPRDNIIIKYNSKSDKIMFKMSNVIIEEDAIIFLLPPLEE